MVLAAARSDAVETRAVATTGPETGEPFARNAGVEFCQGLSALLERPDVDVVYLATPTPLHHQQVLEALDRGKHAIVEKPMAATLEQAEEIVRAADRAGKIVLVGHSHSYDLPYKELRRVAASGEL